MASEETAADARPLSGKRVLVTRAREQADSLARLLEEAGADPIVLPTIQLEPPPSWDEADGAIDALQWYDWVVFTSANGVRRFLDRLAVLRRGPNALTSRKLAAIGPATAAALRSAGLSPDLVPERYVAEAVAAALIERDVVGRRILLARAAEARDVLPTLLRDAGAVVDEVAVYRTVASPEATEGARDLLTAGRVDAVTFSSSSTVRYLIAALDGDASALSSVVVACIGPITAATARDLGVRADVVAEEYTMQGLVRALEEHYRRRPA